MCVCVCGAFFGLGHGYVAVNCKHINTDAQRTRQLRPFLIRHDSSESASNVEALNAAVWLVENVVKMSRDQKQGGIKRRWRRGLHVKQETVNVNELRLQPLIIYIVVYSDNRFLTWLIHCFVYSMSDNSNKCPPAVSINQPINHSNHFSFQMNRWCLSSLSPHTWMKLHTINLTNGAQALSNSGCLFFT